MLWKIYNIHSGKVLKAGFEDEDEAKEWLEDRDHLALEDYLIEEMDADEEEEWLESQEESSEASEDEVEEEVAASSEEEEEVTVDNYGDDYLDGADIDDDYMATVYDEDEVE